MAFLRLKRWIRECEWEKEKEWKLEDNWNMMHQSIRMRVVILYHKQQQCTHRQSIQCNGVIYQMNIKTSQCYTSLKLIYCYTEQHGKPTTGRTKLRCATTDDALSICNQIWQLLSMFGLSRHSMDDVNVLLAIALKTQCAPWNVYIWLVYIAIT